MGPKLISHVSKKTQIRYSLRILPFGGYVSMVGEDEVSSDPNALSSKPAWQRAIIMAAGSFMNLLLGVVLMFTIVALSPSVGTNIIAQFDEGASSAQSGLQINDKILEIDGNVIHTSQDIVYEIMRGGIEPINVKVERQGEIITVEDVVFPTASENGMLIGTTDFKVYATQKTPLLVLRNTFYQSISTVKMIWESLFDLLSGRYGIEQVSGPVGVTQVIGEAAQTSSYSLLYLCTFIAINLGVMNLLPLPALDGGRIFFLIIEIVRRRPIRPELEGYIHFAGIVLLMVFMLFITYKDILKLITG